MPTVIANGTELYYEVRGGGPSVLLISGLPDGGAFRKLAENIADEFTVVLYDRRGLSRSPRPKVWGQTSMTEQSDDAAALIRALGVAPAAVVGNSLGALIALELSLRHPEVVRGVCLLDTGPIDAGVANRRERIPEVVRFCQTGPGEVGPEVLFENFLRFVGAWDVMDLESRQRALADAEMFISHEAPMIDAYRPSEALMKASRVPVQVGAAERSSLPIREMAQWVASQFNVGVDVTPGGHVGYMERPDEVARAIRPFLQRVTRAHEVANQQ